MFVREFDSGARTAPRARARPAEPTRSWKETNLIAWMPLIRPTVPSLANTWGMLAGSRDHWPRDYERGRPGWPRATVELPHLPPAATVLDVGAGTGKLTRATEYRRRWETQVYWTRLMHHPN